MPEGGPPPIYCPPGEEEEDRKVSMASYATVMDPPDRKESDTSHTTLNNTLEDIELGKMVEDVMIKKKRASNSSSVSGDRKTSAQDGKPMESVEEVGEDDEHKIEDKDGENDDDKDNDDQSNKNEGEVENVTNNENIDKDETVVVEDETKDNKDKDDDNKDMENKDTNNCNDKSEEASNSDDKPKETKSKRK